MDDRIPYLLLTPGPLTTSPTVKQAMLSDYCTWDADYHGIVADIRRQLVDLVDGRDEFTSVLMQGSGTFAVEATIGSVVPPDGKLLVVDNGAYGRRIGQIACCLRIPLTAYKQSEVEPADVDDLERILATEPDITHVAMVHCETTTGLMNPAAEVGKLCRQYGKVYILDAMSSLGGIPLTAAEVAADYLVSSANKCIQGVPGFGFVIARREQLEQSRGWARSLSLDLYDQWREMEQHGGKWRFTSPTHVVRAFAQALVELKQEGGVPARARRYRENHRVLVEGMTQIGFQPLVAPQHQSPIITSFLYPPDRRFEFADLYAMMKARHFVLYPGKVSDASTFRVGTIGHVFPADIRLLIDAVRDVVAHLGITQWT